MGLLRALLGVLGASGAGAAEVAHEDGYRAGIERTLCALEGTASAGCYAGPVPQELRAWIAETRALMAAP